MNYYFLSWADDRKVSGVSAFVSEDTGPDHALIQKLDRLNEAPFELSLVKLTEENNGLKQENDLSGLHDIWLDYLPNNLAWPLMSEKLKTIISENLTGNEGIDWIRVYVSGNGERRTYYVLRFKEKLDVLDLKNTLFVKGTDAIIKPCFSLPKISKYNIFHKPLSHNLWKITSGLYVSDVMKKALSKGSVTGVEFSKTKVV